MAIFPSITITLPSWVHAHASRGQVFPSIEERMRFVISLAAANVERKTGGPFGAAIFERDSGTLVAPGVNLVEAEKCSLAHAEAVAIALAQRVLETYNLGDSRLPKLELVTSAQPCIQCWGNLWWSGLGRLITGASVKETQAITGFDEGPVPENWAELLRNRTPSDRAVEVIEKVLSNEACAVLRRYVEQGGVLY